VNVFTQRPRAAQKLATRERILEEARQCFAERGFEATTIRDVAACAGVAVGTVFVHFADKHALLAATLDDQLDQVLSRALATLPAADARAKVRHVLKALFQRYARQPALSRVLVREMLFVEGPQRPPARARVQAFVGLLETWCREPGALEPGLAARDAADAIFAAYIAALIEGLGEPAPRASKMLARVDRLIAPWFTNGGRP
jgi:AcrR family transcriptional regulator